MHNLFIRQMLQMLDNATQAIAMSHDQQFIGRLQAWENDAFPIRHDTVNRIFQRFGTRQLLVGHFPVTFFKTRVARVVFRQRVRGDVVTATPHQYLLVSILGGGLGFVQPLQLTVMLFVQPP